MEEAFRKKVLDAGNDSMDIVTNFIKGVNIPGPRAKLAIQVVKEAVRVSHMNQIKEQNSKSLALRLIQFLPNEPKIREKYIQMTNPELKPLLLLSKPKKK